MGLSLTRPLAVDMTLVMISATLISSKDSSILPASILARSSMSLISPSRCWPEL